MNNPYSKVARIKLLSIVITIAVISVFVYTMQNEVISTVTKIIAGMSLFVGGWAVHFFLDTKINSIKCPSCQKPILIKTAWYDQNGLLSEPYKKCHFCGYEF